MGARSSRRASSQKNRDSSAGQHPHPIPSKNCYNIVRWYDGDDDDNGDDDGDDDGDDGDKNEDVDDDDVNDGDDSDRDVGDDDKDGEDDDDLSELDEIKNIIFSIWRQCKGCVGGVCQVVVCVPMTIRVIYSE